MKPCRACESTDLIPLMLPPRHAGPWYQCQTCRSYTSDNEYADAVHAYHPPTFAGRPDFEYLITDLTTNLDYLERYAGYDPWGETKGAFLDIGCAEGAAVEGMRRRDWFPWGFDVGRAAEGDHIVIADDFKANLFPINFSAVLCREVIEHVPDYRAFLAECFKATAPGGVFEVQTPRPVPIGSISEDELFPLLNYQHLVLFSPEMLTQSLALAGFQLLDTLYWPTGQLVVCRRPK